LVEGCRISWHSLWVLKLFIVLFLQQTIRRGFALFFEVRAVVLLPIDDLLLSNKFVPSVDTLISRMESVGLEFSPFSVRLPVLVVSDLAMSVESVHDPVVLMGLSFANLPLSDRQNPVLLDSSVQTRVSLPIHSRVKASEFNDSRKTSQRFFDIVKEKELVGVRIEHIFVPESDVKLT
jgi:hypothetical protein